MFTRLLDSVLPLRSQTRDRRIIDQYGLRWRLLSILQRPHLRLRRFTPERST